MFTYHLVIESLLPFAKTTPINENGNGLAISFCLGGGLQLHENQWENRRPGRGNNGSNPLLIKIEGYLQYLQVFIRVPSHKVHFLLRCSLEYEGKASKSEI